MTRYLLALVAVVALTACKVDPFCVQCVDQDAGANPGNNGQGGNAGFDGRTDAGPTDSGTGGMDAPDDAGGDGDAPVEVCNGADDDGDDEVDEDFDLNVDVAHCGGCDQACAPPNAFGTCDEGTCRVETCAVGTYDINGSVDDGCEYECSPVEEDDVTCDDNDDDCDGKTDEDIDKATDASNCGECGRFCVFNNAPGVCVDGGCTYTECDEGHYDIDGMSGNGCEYACTPSTDPQCDGVADCELCNGADDDCDMRIDEAAEGDVFGPQGGGDCGNMTGECLPGQEYCVEGALICQGGVNPETEKCDNLDNDCDGETDEYDVLIDRNCEESRGTCEAGRNACVDGAIVCQNFVGPEAEVCDGLDNDCDGVIDNGPLIEDPNNPGTMIPDPNGPGGGGNCGTELGECEFGTQQCRNGGIVCTGGVTAVDETCDNLDNDCDETIDEGNPGGGRVCGDGTGQCVQGRQFCVAGILECQGGTGPVDETCDGLDNDCDTQVDEGNPGGGSDCGSDVGECAFGAEICTNGIFVCQGDTGPIDELCDGLDNDCDGSIDEGNPGGGKLCGDGTGQCVQGVEACVGGTIVCEGDVGPVDEECDGLDNDCDGVIDNGNPGGGAACGNTTGECTAGQILCNGGVFVCDPGVTPVDELCDTLDNDCDGSVDEGNPEGGRLCGESAGQCIQGIEFCDNGSFTCQGGVTPVNETCDGLDNDCDGTIDEGNPGGGAQCGIDTGECTFGSTLCNGGVFVCDPGVTPVDELCDDLDNDCDGSVDEGNPQGGKLCGDGDGTCVKGREACVGGSIMCQGGTGPVSETCDGLDNDCDTIIDEGNPGGGAACGNTTGECTAGSTLCTGGVFVCSPGVTPVDELCDTLDNDCDGMVDEGNPEGGKLCGDSEGTCSPGIQTCTSGAIQCVGATGPAGETCDGLDNDCDGSTDENNPGGGGQCGSATGECAVGSQVCQGGVFVCQGATVPVTEACDGLDNDCDGMADEGNPDSGGLCGSDIGQCSTGVEQCMGGGLLCTGQTESVTEVCDGLDNDCDGSIDENNPGGGASCGSAVGQCSEGTLTCQGGALVCNGPVLPVAETCDDLDNDCDGMVDETYNKQGDINNCGSCGNVCDLDDAVQGCNMGNCVVAACRDGFHDINMLPGDGCEYACNVAGTEACNGADDDCDMMTDEGLTPPTFFCNANGVCAGTNASCGGVDGWECNYPSTYSDVDSVCDDLDNDCDGLIDEEFPTLGTGCFDGIGACRQGGIRVCNALGSGVECNAADPGDPADEECDNIDNDCDTFTDERVADDLNTPWRDGVDETAISRVTVARSGGGTMEIMQYEASRPDATTGAAGSKGGYACSNPDVKPWTNVTWTEANNACCGLNPGDYCPGAMETGYWRLCEAPDWERACQGDDPMNPCDWGYTSSCSSSQPVACNGEEYDCDPNTPNDEDCLLDTGALSECGADWSGAGVVYDLSGNAKEWTATESASGIYEIRGGSYTSIEAGRTCDFSFVSASAGFSHPNTGFRCCYY